MKKYLLALSLLVVSNRADDSISSGSFALIHRETPKYKILASDLSPAGHRPPMANYRVSVMEPLTQLDIESVVCDVLAKQQPQDVEILRVFLYLRLDAFFADVASNPRNKEVYRKALAAYFWNKHIPGNPRALQLYKDETGHDFPGGPRYFFHSTIQHNAAKW